MAWQIQRLNNLSTQQVTSKTPTTLPKQKNPKRVAAGKAIPEERRQAREAQKKTLAEAEVIIAKSQLKQAETAATSGEAKVDENAKNILTTTQWLSVISIFVSLARIYYKREEIKSFLTKKPPQTPSPQANTTPPTLVDASSKRKGGICPMD